MKRFAPRSLLQQLDRGTVSNFTARRACTSNFIEGQFAVIAVTRRDSIGIFGGDNLHQKH
jgi:hypothetical protein